MLHSIPDAPWCVPACLLTPWVARSSRAAAPSPLTQEPVLSEKAGQHSETCQQLSALLTQISAKYLLHTAQDAEVPRKDTRPELLVVLINPNSTEIITPQYFTAQTVSWSIAVEKGPAEDPTDTGKNQGCAELHVSSVSLPAWCVAGRPGS